MSRALRSAPSPCWARAAAYKTARADRNAPVQITGIIGAGLSLVFFLYFMVPNIWTVSGLSRASYFILIAWSILGFLIFQRVFRRDTHERFGKTTAVWIALLFMILFTSMLWLREATHETTDKVLSDLSGYNETELVEHGVALSEEDEAEDYLQQKMAEDDNHIMVGVGLNEDMKTRNALTGLRAETSFYVRGRELLQEHPEGWCVVAIDLEHFKLFNEWYGREAGDMLLAQIGEFLNAVETGNEGIAGYLGQDDFALLVPYDKERIRKLFDSIHGFIMERGNTIGFMPAFGICMAERNTSAEELLDRASQAAHHAKENYHDRIRIFEESMYRQTERDYQILSDFQSALQNNELFIMLQPQCELAEGRVVGAESLVRWKKADGSMISPGVFVPVLERYGFVTDLDQFVWDEVCAWQRRWIDGGHTPLPVSVNVSQINIFAIDVPSHVELLLWKYNLPVNVIKIEITESAYVGDGAVADTVKRLREKGFLVLLDDGVERPLRGAGAAARFRMRRIPVFPRLLPIFCKAS